MSCKKNLHRERFQLPSTLVIDVPEIASPLPSLIESPIYTSGGIKLTVSGIGIIPEKSEHSIFSPSKSMDNGADSPASRCCKPLASAVSYHPRYSQEAILFISEMGRGTSSIVHRCIYVPTLSFVALKVINVSSPSLKKQIEMELKTLYTFKIRQNESQLNKEKVVDSSMSDSSTKLRRVRDQIASEGITQERHLQQSRGEIVGLDQLDIDINTIHAATMRKRNINNAEGHLSEIWSDQHQINNESNASTSLEPAAALDAGASVVPYQIPDDPPGSNSSETFPYIVTLYDAYVSSDAMSVCLVLEYMAGGSLKRYIMEGRPTGELEVAVVAYSVLQALNALHSRNIIHRDIKPANILIKGDGTVKVSDFGISRETISDDSNNMMTFVGSMAYMSPERIRGEGYGKSSDIWSLGITLMYFITCKPQISDCTSYWGMLDALERHNPTIEERGTAKCSSRLNDFLSMCLEKNPMRRPSAAQLLESDFILHAISTGAISRSVQPTLMKPRKVFTPAAVVRNIVTSILDWSPEHKSEMILFDQLLSHCEIAVTDNTSNCSECDTQDSRKLAANRAKFKSSNLLYSKRAVLHLSSVLNVNPSVVMRIIIGRHLNWRKKMGQ